MTSSSQSDNYLAEAQALLEGFPGGAVLTDIDGGVHAANGAGVALSSLLRDDERPEFLNIVARAAENQTIVVDTVELEGEGGIITLEIVVIPHLIGSGNERDHRFLLLARDMTMEKNLRTALTDSRQRYKDLVEVSSDFTWETGKDGRFVFVTPKGALGYAADDLVGKPFANIVVHPDEWDPMPFLANRSFEDIEILLRRKDETIALVVLSSIPVFDREKNHTGNRGVCRDITYERAQEEALGRARQRKELLNFIAKSIRDELNPMDMLTTAAKATTRGLDAKGCCIYRKDLKGHFIQASEHNTPDGINGIEQAIPQLAALDDGEIWQTAMDNKTILAAPTRYRGTVNGAVCLWRPEDQNDWDDDHRMLVNDIANQLGIANEQIANHQRILTMSRTDAMTGMLNRRAFFEEELPRRLARLEKDKKGAALLYVDMDNFKMVNDVKGHQAGDDAILMLRDLLIEHSRPGDESARLGGDEFAVWLDGIPPDRVEDRTKELLKASERLRAFSGSPDKPLGISIGVAIYDPNKPEDLDSLVARADEAMYVIKHGEKGGYHIAPPPE